MNRKQNKWLWLLALLGMAAYFHFAGQPAKPEQGAAPQQTAVVEQSRVQHTDGAPAASQTGDNGAELIARAFAEQRSDVQVSGSGTVHRTLPDDTQGSRHQRFIMKLSNGQTVLVAHNIDLAPRIPRLQRGDTVGFSGEYEYNAQGGVIHWTHHDPAGRHANGWLEHNGQRYQ
ncbi:DUF3465 domain-containing protein [Eikenella sp. S3360]|uniref:DUF3465 domain-containing protein n=1 Tax=Eikenella glucosivorans TaxID=2766967 RepID=A0ABS0NBM1_9NEIS|nr:DUF3465 domain-containing protein [Eikenella glucosivorans]MBH5329723.1 DUF3465 domain-containing protein [Eikenella glucosivorans]